MVFRTILTPADHGEGVNPSHHKRPKAMALGDPRWRNDIHRVFPTQASWSVCVHLLAANHQSQFPSSQKSGFLVVQGTPLKTPHISSNGPMCKGSAVVSVVNDYCPGLTKSVTHSFQLQGIKASSVRQNIRSEIKTRELSWLVCIYPILLGPQALATTN